MTDPPAPEPETPDSEGSEPSAPPAADPAASPPEQSEMWAASEPHENLLARTRASETWIALIVFALILVLLLIFVLQNTQKVEISYFAADFKIPLAVAMLLSAVAGVLLTAIAGTLRILQLRRRVRTGQRG